jgi:hypothetical protein
MDNVSRYLAHGMLDVQQECKGSTIPEPIVEYPQSFVTCSGNSRPATVRHAVQLGMTCSDGTFYADVAVECAAVSHDFDFLNALGLGLPEPKTRFTCTESVTFSAGSTQPVPLVAVTTDDRWVEDPFTDCFTVVTAPTSPKPPSRAPVSMPSSTAPIAVPFSTPTASLPAPTAILPAPSTLMAPLSAPMTSPQVIPRSNGSDSGFAAGLAVGGAAVAIAFAGIVVVFAMRRRSSQDNDQTPKAREPEFAADSSYDGVDHTAPGSQDYYSPQHDQSLDAAETDMRPTTPSYPQRVASVATANTATTSLSSGQSSSRQASAARPVNALDLDYKDQTRSARRTPQVAAIVEPTSLASGGSGTSTGTAQFHNSLTDAAAMPVAIALDISSITGVSGNSGGSNSTKRRAIDP